MFWDKIFHAAICHFSSVLSFRVLCNYHVFFSFSYFRKSSTPFSCSVLSVNRRANKSYKNDYDCTHEKSLILSKSSYWIWFHQDNLKNPILARLIFVIILQVFSDLKHYRWRFFVFCFMPWKEIIPS